MVKFKKWILKLKELREAFDPASWSIGFILGANVLVEDKLEYQSED